MKPAIVILAICLVTGNSAQGKIDSCNSDWGASCQGMILSICPLGDFESIRDGCGSGGDYIWVRVIDEEGEGVPGIPSTDYWLQAADPEEELCLCASPITADSVTDSSGRTTFSGPILGGGCAVGGGLTMSVQGKIIIDMPACTSVKIVDIVIVSPDINADCRVDLSDLALFGLGYNKSDGEAGYDPCCDFNHDGQCTLSDFAYFAEHYQHTCF